VIAAYLGGDLDNGPGTSDSEEAIG
jgi:hypothetical protein